MVYLGTTVSIYRHLKTHFIQNDRFSYCLVLFRQDTQSTTVGFQQGFIRPEKHLLLTSSLVMIILNLLLYTCQELPCRVVYGYTKYSCEYNLWRVPYLVIIPLHCILILTVMLCVGENLFWPEPPDNPHIHASLTFIYHELPPTQQLFRWGVLSSRLFYVHLWYWRLQKSPATLWSYNLPSWHLSSCLCFLVL